MTSQPTVYSFNDLAKLTIQRYERYLPTAFDESMSILEKMNKIINWLNSVTDATNGLVDQWNTVMTWVMNDGLSTDVNTKLDAMVADGTFNTLIEGAVFTDFTNRLTAAEGNITTNTTNIGTNASGLTAANNRLTTDESNLNGRSINIKYPPGTLAAAKVDGSTDDSDAINAIANYLSTTYGGGTLLFPSGITSIAKTINLPDGVNVQGAGTPYSVVSPQAAFTGSYCFESINTDTNTHHQIKDLFINFGNNANVGGIWLHRPYDYTALRNLIGNRCCKQFIKIGNVGNTGPAQTVMVESCIAYGWTGRSQPLLSVEYSNECTFINNKFLGVSGDTLPVALFDSVTQQTLIGNSFAFTDSDGALTFKATKSNYRLSGNHISHNLFEGCNGAYSLQIIGIAGSTGEGDSNSVISNRYMNSTSKIYLDGVVGTQVIDYVADVITGSGARKNIIITPVHVSGTNSTGDLFLTADGKDIRLPVDGAGIVMDSPDGTKHVRISVDNTGALVTAIVS